MIDVRIAKKLGHFALDIAFATPAKGITAIYGRSGAGKTSIVKAIAGALAPDDGHINLGPRTYFDRARNIDLAAHERRIGYVFQDSRLFPHMSVKANLLYGYNRARGEKRHTFDDVVALLDLNSVLDRRTHRLSGGERQRVAIGRALLAQPEVMLMDEPLSSLDPARKSEVMPYIEGLRDELGLPVIYISHAFNEVMRLADSLVLIDQGRVVRAGPLMELAADPALSPYLGRFEAGAVIECCVERHEQSVGLSVLSFNGGTLRVPRVDLAKGEPLRVRIRARDVAIALSEPTDVSIANRLPGRITAIIEEAGAYANISIDVGGTVVRALITRDSVSRLDLGVGRSVWVLIKAVAFDGRSVGFRRRARALSDGPA